MIMQQEQENCLSSTEYASDEKTKSDDPPPTSDDENAEESPHKLFIGGLPYNVTDPEFWEFFSQFGEVDESEVMFDRQKRRPRGFGFVTYTNPNVTRKLLKMGDNGDGIGRIVMRGKTCEVKAASPKPPLSPARGAGGKSNKNGRLSPDPRNDEPPRVPHSHRYQEQHRLSPSFGYEEQFPVMYRPHDNCAMMYPQGVPSGIMSVPGYAPPMFHHSAILLHHPSYPPPQETIPPFAVPPIATHFYPATMPQIPANYFFPHDQHYDNNAFISIPSMIPAPVHFCA